MANGNHEVECQEVSAAIDARQGTLAIGEYLLQLDSHELQRGSEVFVLEPKQLGVLVELLRRAPRTVSQEELLALVWPNVVVTDNTIHQTIAALRRALGDNARQPIYIGTQARRGYRWVGPLPDKAPATQRSSADKQGKEKQRLFLHGLLASLVLFGATFVVIQAFYPKAKSAADVLLDPPLTVFVSDFESGTGSVLSDAHLSGFRDQLLSALLKVNTIRITDDVTVAQFRVSAVVTFAVDNLVMQLQLRDIQRQSILWAHSFTLAEDDQKFVTARLAADLLAQVGKWFAMEQTMLGLNFADPIAVREFVLGHIEFLSVALGVGGNELVAVEHFREALRLEPDFWAPQMQLTILYANRLGSPLAYEEHVRRTHGATHRLLELRRLHGENASIMIWAGVLAIVSQRLELDYDFSELMWQQARDQGWNAGQVHVELATIHEARTEFELAKKYYTAAQSGDAQLNSTVAKLNAGRMLIAMNELEQARHLLSGAAAELTDDNPVAAAVHVEHVFVLFLLQEPSAAIHLDKAWTRHGAQYQDMFPGVLAMGGRKLEAKTVLSDMTQRFAEGSLYQSWDAAIGHLYLGNLDTAFVWLSRAVENREVRNLSHIKRARYLDPMRSDPRFDQILERIVELEAIKSPLRAMVAEHEAAMQSGG